jgi:hypothetical protein
LRASEDIVSGIIVNDEDVIKVILEGSTRSMFPPAVLGFSFLTIDEHITFLWWVLAGGCVFTLVETVHESVSGTEIGLVLFSVRETLSSSLPNLESTRWHTSEVMGIFHEIVKIVGVVLIACAWTMFPVTVTELAFDSEDESRTVLSLFSGSGVTGFEAFLWGIESTERGLIFRSVG